MNFFDLISDWGYKADEDYLDLFGYTKGGIYWVNLKSAEKSSEFKSLLEQEFEVFPIKRFKPGWFLLVFYCLETQICCRFYSAKEVKNLLKNKMDMIGLQMAKLQECERKIPVE